MTDFDNNSSVSVVVVTPLKGARGTYNCTYVDAEKAVRVLADLGQGVQYQSAHALLRRLVGRPGRVARPAAALVENGRPRTPGDGRESQAGQQHHRGHHFEPHQHFVSVRPYMIADRVRRATDSVVERFGF